MAHYHCPYCNALIQHRHELAGERVVCSKCNGEYFEPTDPLPGVKPDKVPQTEGAAPAATAATPPVNPTATASPSERTISTGPTLGEATPHDMVAELTRRGIPSVVIMWDKHDSQHVDLEFGESMNRQEAETQVIQLAAEMMHTRWPDLRQLIISRLRS